MAWLLIVILALNGCAVRVITLPPPRYHNAELGFSISIPKGWQVREGSNGAVVSLLMPPQAGQSFRPNCNVQVESRPLDETEEDYYGKLRQQLEITLGHYELNEQRQVQLAGRDVRRTLVTATVNGQGYKVIVYSVRKQPHVYTIECTATAEQYPLVNGTLDALVQSFQLD